MPRSHRLSAVLLVGVLAFGTIACSQDSGGSSGRNPVGPGSVNRDLRYVAPNGSDATDCLNISNPCLTPQHAHDVAGSDDRIEVRAGTYGRLVITKSIYLKREALNPPTLTGGITVDGGGLGVSDLTIEGFAIRPGASGAVTGVVVRELTQSDSLSLSYVDVAGFPYRGIDIGTIAGGGLFSSNSSITGIVSSDDGINIRNLGLAGSSIPTVSLDNVTVSGHGAGDGVQFSDVQRAQIRIRSSRIALNGQAGVQIETMQGGSFELSLSCIRKNGTQAGISLGGINSATVTVSESNIVENPSRGAEIDSTSSTVADMRNNWWNAANGPSYRSLGGGDSITDGITYLPFRSAPVPPPANCF